METQRLITVSLGKIAQSRCQRGGINLHKNLLVATVLHKARTAYMMESYNYQQTVQRQKLQQYSVCSPSQSVDESNKGEACPTPDSNLGHTTPVAADQNMSALPIFVQNELVIPEPVTSQDMEADVCHINDKENSPPCPENRLVPIDNITVTKSESVNHLSASNQLSQEAQQSLSSNSSSCKVLKRRRNNQDNSSTEHECPVSKKARVSCEVSLSPATFTDYSDQSSDESDLDSDTSDSPQISNLVNIFNSGFSGLCAVTNESVLSSTGYDSDSDVSNSQFSHVRPESPSPAFSRILSEPTLLCSTQVSRLESMPSAIILSA